MPMKPPKDVSRIFNKFAGREVEMNETVRTLKFKFIPDVTTTEVSLKNPKDPLVKAMNDEAAKNGLELRLWLPGTTGTMDLRSDRVNAHIEKEADCRAALKSEIVTPLFSTYSRI